MPAQYADAETNYSAESMEPLLFTASPPQARYNVHKRVTDDEIRARMGRKSSDPDVWASAARPWIRAVGPVGAK